MELIRFLIVLIFICLNNSCSIKCTNKRQKIETIVHPTYLDSSKLYFIEGANNKYYVLNISQIRRLYLKVYISKYCTLDYFFQNLKKSEIKPPLDSLTALYNEPFYTFGFYIDYRVLKDYNSAGIRGLISKYGIDEKEYIDISQNENISTLYSVGYCFWLNEYDFRFCDLYWFYTCTKKRKENILKRKLWINPDYFFFTPDTFEKYLCFQ